MTVINESFRQNDHVFWLIVCHGDVVSNALGLDIDRDLDRWHAHAKIAKQHCAHILQSGHVSECEFYQNVHFELFKTISLYPFLAECG